MSSNFNLERQLKEINTKLDKLLSHQCNSDDELANVNADLYNVGDVLYVVESPGEYKLMKVQPDNSLIGFERVDERQAQIYREEIDQEAHYFWYVEPGKYPLEVNESGFLDIRRKAKA